MGFYGVLWGSVGFCGVLWGSVGFEGGVSRCLVPRAKGLQGEQKKTSEPCNPLHENKAKPKTQSTFCNATGDPAGLIPRWPSALNPTPEALSPKPETRNPKT